MEKTMSSTSLSDKNNEIHEKRWAIVALSSIPLIMTLGNSMLIPVLPLMEKEIGITKVQSSYIITFYSIVAIILIPIAGFLSDRYGRKIVIIPSLIITGIGGLIAAYAAWKISNPFLFILIGRTLQGVGTAGAAPIVLPLVGDMFHRDRDVSATLGIIETSNTFGKVLSPILGSFLASIIWFLPFTAIPVFCLISVLSVLFLVKKPKHDQAGPSFKDFLSNTKKAFHTHSRWLLAVFAIGAIVMFVLFAVLFYLSSNLESQYHYHGVKKGFILAIPLAALCLASYVTGKLIKENMVLMKWIIFSSVIVTGAAILIIRFSDHFIYLITVFLISGIGIGASLPPLDALINQSIEKNVRGTISSIYSSMRYIGVAAGPLFMAYFMNKNVMISFMIMAVLCLVAAGLTFVAVKPEEKENIVPSPT
ncbi:MFS transporter [Bacillus ginsengihumi]|uniref:MFS transporter n=1 Tax=Heyndrickxia ginsengihumi TaxID=363870 RepID=A0A6M0P5N1_9BACI|nr:MFS transporter [Heyndrickxia ginsengihumi]NEY19851.1 MFS transporter [Heyndrickxia ginsengihumi]